VWVWTGANGQAEVLPAALLAARFFAIVLAIFLLVVVLFAALGQRLGALFDALPATPAYSVNLIASLAGIWAFAAVSWLGWPPAGWLGFGFVVLLLFVVAWPIGRAWQRPTIAVGLMGATLALVALAPGATRWSPYYRVDLSPYLVPDVTGQEDAAGYKLTVNHDYHQ